MAQIKAQGSLTIIDTNDIESIIVEYARNQSTSNAPTSGWSTTRPAWAQGYYIWQRTRIHKTGTSTSEDTFGTAVCITGSTGQTGAALTVSSITYAVSTTETQPQDSSFTYTTVPTVAEGSWLWTKTEYSDSSKIYTKSKQGKSGTSVTVTKVEYQSGTSPTTAPTGSWNTSIPSVAEGNYLWTKTTYSDNNYSYTVAKQGKSGTSVSISSTSVKYQIGTSATTAPTGTWQDNVQATTTGQFLWTRTIVTYSDGSSTTSYSVSAHGATGSSVSVSSIKYAKSTTDAQPQDSSFGTTIPSVGEGEWLWTMTTYSNGSKMYTKSKQGESGRSLTATETKYVNVASGTTQTQVEALAENAWVTNVPPYDVSKPDYWIRVKNTYDKAPTTVYIYYKDNATSESLYNSAMANSLAQSANENANGAMSQAAANIQTITRLWYAKANSTAPAAPTTHVTTSSATTYNAWNIKRPNANDSYPYYFYCDETCTGGGVYSWSEVTLDTSNLSQYQIGALTTKVRNYWWDSDGAHIASGTSSGEEITASSPISDYGYNTLTGLTGISFRYNNAKVVDLNSTTPSLDFYKPPTISGSTVTQGALTMRLSSGGLAFYDGSSANGGNIQAQFGSTGAIQSGDYAINVATDKFSTYGTKIDLVHGEIYSPYFRLSQGSVSGGPVAGIYMSGTFESTGAIIGHQKTSNSDTNAYWKIGYMTDTNQDRLTYQRADSNGFIELAPSATFILQKNKIHTGWFGSNGYLTYPQLNSKYYDFGMNLPTSLSDKFLYIRYNSGSNLSTIYQNDSGWTYPFYVDAEGKVHAQNFYIGDSTTPIGGGSGTIAEKLMSGAGSATQPVYFRSDSGHVGEVATTTYALNAAGAKGVDTSMPTTATDNNVPTTKLMKTFVEGKGYITGYTETDPTVPSWAKASSKPTYALSEITSADDIKAIEALTGTSGFLKKTAANTWTLDTNTYLTSYTESDPTVPSWAKQSSKPSYGLTEISGTTDLQAIEALTGTKGFLKKTNSNTWTLDTNTYLTSYTETDPIFTASAAANITSSDITNWNGKTSNVGTVTSVKVQGSNGLTGNGTVTDSGTITISHADTSSQASSSNSGRTYIQSIMLDDYGHVTGVSTATESVTDTHYTTHLYAGKSDGSANAATTNGNTYLMVLDNTTVRDRRKISGSGAASVTSDSSGNITINSPVAITGVSFANGTITFTKSDSTTIPITTDNFVITQATGATALVKLKSGSTSEYEGYSAGGATTAPVYFDTSGHPVAVTSIPWNLIASKPNSYTPSSHTHGNLSNDGKITSTATIANGDKLVIVDTDSTANSTITGSSITFGTSTSTFLSNKGTWETPVGTTYTFDGTYNASSNKAATVSTVTNAINALDVSAQTGAQSKTITSISETDGKISVTYSNISITKSQISDFPTSMAPTAHNHSQIITVGDQRSTATTPNSYSNALIFQGLKSKATVGSPSDDTYSYLVGLRGWSDSSGGNSHELAFNNTGIFWRQGATTSWGNWYRIYTTGNKPTASDVGLGNVTNYDSSVAIKSITRSGTTFTYTTVAGNTGTFTQQDNNTWDALSTSQAGYVAKAPNDTGKFLRGDATWAAVTKSNVGLGNVENTALSTWTGTNKITTLGTITTGTWNGSAIPVANGGTGATTATNARSNLGLGSAATASTTTSITSGGTGLPTAGTVYTYVSNQVGNYVAKSGDTMTGTLTVPELVATKIKADDVNVTHLLTAEGIETKNWTATNISTIDGSFYICPTISCSTGTIKYTSSGGTLEMTAGSGKSFNINSIFTTSNNSAAWTSSSWVMITGEVLIRTEYCPIGTVRGKITATTPTTSKITISNLTTNLTDNTSPKIIELMTSGTAYTFRDLKISLYSYYNNSQENLLGIMLTTAGAGNRTYIDIYDGTNKTNGKTSTSGFSYTEPVVRVGNLNGLNSYVQSGKFTVTPEGWGIYTTNGFFVGDVYAENGYIGGFTIGANDIHNGKTSKTETNNNGVWVGTDGIGFGKGVTYFSTDGTGKIGPWDLSTTYIRNGNITGANNTTVAGVYLGTNGLNISGGSAANTAYIYKNGSTVSVNIGNKLTWDGSALSVNGAITATSLTINNTNYLNSITSIPTISTTADNASYSVEIKVTEIDYSAGTAKLVAIPTYKGGASTGQTFTWYKNAINTAHGGTVTTTTNTNDTLSVSDLNAIYIAVLS